MKHVVDKGKSQTPKDKVGENLYNRGVYNSVLDRRGDPQRAEAHRQEGRDRRGRAARPRDANITAARWKEIGLTASPRRSSVTCTDHNGHHAAYMQQWDGTKWVKVSDWIAPMKDKVRPLLEAAAKDYVDEEPAAGRSAPSLRQVVVTRSNRLSRARAGERRASRSRTLPDAVADDALRERRADDGNASTAQPTAAADRILVGQQYRGDLRPRHPGAQGRVARRAARAASWRCSAPTAPARPRR